jgi:tetratricopeptide (TPR) repeat protein
MICLIIHLLLIFNITLSKLNEAKEVVLNIEEEVESILIQYINNYNNITDPYSETSDDSWIECRFYFLERGGGLLPRDFDGSGYEMTPEDYFLALNKQKENGIRVQYVNIDEVEVYECSLDGQLYYGAFLEKEVEKNGKFIKYTEFIEMSSPRYVTGGQIIRRIRSSLVSDFNNLECDNSSKGDHVEECSILNLANYHYQKEEYGIAINYYQKALDCSNDRAFVKNRIEQLSTKQVVENILKTGNVAFSQDDFYEAISKYEEVLKYEEFLNAHLISEINKRVITCRNELAYAERVSGGDYYFRQNLFEQAKMKYIEADKFKKLSGNALRNLRICNEKIEENIKEKQIREINHATRLIEKSNKLIKGVDLLYKYRNSNLLLAKHYVYMATVIDNPKSRRDLRNDYNLSNKDCCVLSRNFLFKAKNLSDGTVRAEDLDYIWNIQFNKRSRTCN